VNEFLITTTSRRAGAVHEGRVVDLARNAQHVSAQQKDRDRQVDRREDQRSGKEIADQPELREDEIERE